MVREKTLARVRRPVSAKCVTLKSNLVDIVFLRVGTREEVTLNLHPSVRNTLSNCFPSTLELKAGVFKFHRFKEHVRKAPNS